ncbi:MAG: hypothetical protein RI953_1432 [Pseudomonadota bacterium]
MPPSLDSLPPPSVEWRRESDEERKQRLEKAGVLQTKPDAGSFSREPSAIKPAGNSVIEQLKNQVVANKEKAKKSYLLWWSADLAKWKAVRTPRDTSTLADGSYSLSVELTHPNWTFSGFRLSFGPKALFFNGGQYAKTVDPFFSGNGYADFNSSEVGLSAALTNYSEDAVGELNWIWSLAAAYTPVRWVKADRTSSAALISRSDTWSRTALNLPGLGFQLGAGLDWNALAKVEVFAGLHGAWPWQVRLRTGVQLSLGLPLDEVPIASR